MPNNFHVPCQAHKPGMEGWEEKSISKTTLRPLEWKTINPVSGYV